MEVVKFNILKATVIMSVFSSIFFSNYANALDFNKQESQIIQNYKKTFLELKKVVSLYYQEEWWSPTKETVSKEIDDFIVKIETNSISNYTLEQIENLPSKIELVGILLDDKCKNKFKKIITNIKITSNEAYIYLKNK